MKTNSEIFQFYKILKDSELIYVEGANKQSIDVDEIIKELTNIENKELQNVKEIVLAYLKDKKGTLKNEVENHINAAINGFISFRIFELHDALKDLLHKSGKIKEENYFELVGIYSKTPTLSVHKIASFIHNKYPKYLRKFSNNLYLGVKKDKYMHSHEVIKMVALKYKIKSYSDCSLNNICFFV